MDQLGRRRTVELERALRTATLSAPPLVHASAAQACVTACLAFLEKPASRVRVRSCCSCCWCSSVKIRQNSVSSPNFSFPQLFLFFTLQ